MTRTPNLPPIIESLEEEYQDSGVTSTVAIAGHPIHPVIVTLPIAFLVAVPASDIGYWLTYDNFWARAALWLVGAGLLTGVLAAITGMMDFFGIKRVRKHTAGWAHMIINVTVLVLTAVNFVLRMRDYTGAILPWGLGISAFVAVLLGLSGWYGGELVYRHKIAVIGYGRRDR